MFLGFREDLLMRNRKVLVSVTSLEDCAVHTATDGVCCRKLLQLAVFSCMEGGQGAVGGGIGCAVLVGAVYNLRLRVEGEPAWHITACLLGVGDREVTARQR